MEYGLGRCWDRFWSGNGLGRRGGRDRVRASSRLGPVVDVGELVVLEGTLGMRLGMRIE